MIPEMRGAFKVRGVLGTREMNNRSAYCAGQSDPCENRQFRRRWGEREAPNPAAARAFEHHSNTPPPVRVSRSWVRAEREGLALARGET